MVAFRKQSLWVAGVLLAASTVAASAQEAVYLIRHAERAEGENPAITEAGRQRAAQWAELLASARIEHVYTSEARRTIETGGIISKALGVSAESVATGDTAGLLDLMSFDYEDARVLVVGHTETIPGILEALGVAGIIEMPKDDYARLFVVVPGDPATLFDLRMP